MMRNWWIRQSNLTRCVCVVSLTLLIIISGLVVSQRLRLIVNLTQSLSFLAGLMVTSDSWKKGDWVVFYPPSSALHKDTDKLVKIISGVSGDIVIQVGKFVLVNGKTIGEIKAQAKNGTPLHSGFVGIIPSNHYFVSSPHPDSFDSRYRELGLISNTQLLGKVVILWGYHEP